MAKIKNPVLFSKHFEVDPMKLANYGLVDPFLNVDTPLFIDPILLEKSKFKLVRENGLTAFKEHFTNFIRLLALSRNEGDAAWKGAARLLTLEEAPMNGLGYGGSGRAGSRRPTEIRDTIMKTSKEIIDLGADDPEMISLMGFFEENVGPDTISDITTLALLKQLANITAKFCQKVGVPVEDRKEIPGCKLPVFSKNERTKSPFVLVPIDIVRDLPIANDWNDIEIAALQNAQIRARVNSFLAGIAQPTIAERKGALKSTVLSSSVFFNTFLAAVKTGAKGYDTRTDELGYQNLRKLLREDTYALKLPEKPDLSVGPDALRAVVIKTINHFKHHVEKGNLWEELWIGSKAKKERASQLMYFAIADAFCRANNIDISPETDMGGGPIDFKFSKGYDARVLVELKKSTGTVKHGYAKQLEIYKDAARTNFGIFVIIDVGSIGKKLEEIQKIRTERIARGEHTSEIIIVDASKKVSASKRK